MLIRLISFAEKSTWLRSSLRRVGFSNPMYFRRLLYWVPRSGRFQVGPELHRPAQGDVAVCGFHAENSAGNRLFYSDKTCVLDNDPGLSLEFS
jgi:hypothetical protein